MKKLLGLFGTLIALSVIVEAVGTVTVTPSSAGLSNLRKYAIAWTSTAGGAVSANTFTLPAGVLVSIRFVPDSGGTQPSNLYDVTLVDAAGADILGGTGANLSNATASIQQWDPRFVYTGQPLDLVIANAGNAKAGTVEILLDPGATR